MALTIFVMPNAIKANDQQIEPLTQTTTINVDDTYVSSTIATPDGYIMVEISVKGTVTLTNYSVVSHNLKYSVSLYDGAGYYIANVGVTTNSVTNSGLSLSIKATAVFDVMRTSDSAIILNNKTVVANYIC